MAIAGAIMLYPIGAPAANVIFVLIKIGMVSGLLILLSAKAIGGFCLWSTCSGGAVIMTIIKWAISGHCSFLIIASMCVDIFLPVIVYNIMKKNQEIVKK